MNSAAAKTFLQVSHLRIDSQAMQRACRLPPAPRSNSVIGFFFPVVPKGEARIRVQISAGMKKSDLDQAIEKFSKVGKAMGVM